MSSSISVAITTGNHATTLVNRRNGNHRFAVQVEIPVAGGGWVAKIIAMGSESAMAKLAKQANPNDRYKGRTDAYGKARNARVVPAYPLAEIPVAAAKDTQKLVAWLQAANAGKPRKAVAARKPRKPVANAVATPATQAALPQGGNAVATPPATT